MKKIIFLLLLILGEVLYANTYYVANSGNDNNNGLSPETAWRTIDKVNASMILFKSGDLIAFKGGDEFYGNLKISGKNGTAVNSITFTSYGTGKAVIKGSEVITGWTNEGGNLWSAIVTGKTIYNVIGKQNARYPKYVGDYATAHNYATVTKSGGTNRFTSSALIGLPNIVGATVHISPWVFTFEARTISAFNSSTGEVTLSTGTNNTISTGTYFFIVNDSDLLTSQGEWSYNEVQKKLYLYSTVSPTNIEAVTNNSTAITIQNSDYITIDALKIKGYNTKGIDTPSSDYPTIQNCEISYIYDEAIVIRDGQGGIINKNVVTNIPKVGINSRNPNALVTGNILSEIGLSKDFTSKQAYTSQGITAVSDNYVLEYNKLSKLGYVGIDFVGKINTIRYNTITDYMLALHDGGAIYTYAPGSSHSENPVNTTVNNNIIISYDFPANWQEMGIYLDNNTHGVSVLNNTILNSNKAIFCNNPKSNSISYNNLYEYKGIGVSLNNRTISSQATSTGNIITYNNIFSSLGGKSLNVEGRDGYADIATYDYNRFFNVSGNKVIRLWDYVNSAVDYTVVEWQPVFNEDANSTQNDFIWEPAKDQAHIAINRKNVTDNVSLPTGTWEDLDGKTYQGSVTLEPFTSVILIKSKKAHTGINANAGVDVQICIGGSIKLEATGGTSYKWSTGETTQSISVKPDKTTTYTVTVSDGTNSASDEVVVTVNETIANAGADRTINVGETISLTATGGDTYLWSTGETTESISVSPVVTTTYSVKATKNGCEATDEVKITVNPAPAPGTITANAGPEVTVCKGENTILTASGGTSYTWSTGETTQSITIKPEKTTTYTVTVSDGTNTASDEVVVTVNETIANAGADRTINEGETISLTATGGDAYLWSTGETTESISVSPVVTTTYSVKVTKNGCEATDEVKVTINPAPAPGTITANAGPDVTVCKGENAILIASGGTSYTWSTGETAQSITVKPDKTTTYTVTVSDGTNSASDEVVVTVNETIAHAGVDRSINAGETISLSATGGDTYLWSTGETTESISVSPVVTTTYSVKATKNGCDATDEVKVTVNPAPAPGTITANAGPDVTVCKGENTLLTASGGTSYIWSTGETTQSITVKPDKTTTYTVTVSNGTNSASDEVVVTVNEVNASAGPDVTIDSGQAISLNATGGDSYLWSTGETSSMITVNPLTTTNYTVKVIKKGCEATDTVQVNIREILPALADAGKDVTLCKGESITLMGGGGTSYSWNNGATTQNLIVSPSRTTTYTLTANRAGTTSTDQVTVTVINCNLNNGVNNSVSGTTGNTSTNNSSDQHDAEVLNKADFELTVYPIPSEGRLNIQTTIPVYNFNLVLMNINGNVIYTDTMDAEEDGLQKELDLSKFAKGVYLIQFYNAEESYVKKIILI